MFQVAGGSVGLGLATTVFTEAAERGGFEDGFQWAFRLVAALGLAGAGGSAALVGRAEDYESGAGDDSASPSEAAVPGGSSE